MYKDPSVTLAGPNSGRMVTLGSFGGSIVYEFEEPIQNSDQNPYGIDFIVYGNVQKSETGESYSSGMEPAAVMVSQDGNTWYELAGSDYYERTTQHNISMTYTNPDTTFKSAVDIPVDRFYRCIRYSKSKHLSFTGILSGSAELRRNE